MVGLPLGLGALVVMSVGISSPFMGVLCTGRCSVDFAQPCKYIVIQPQQCTICLSAPM